MVGTVNSGKRRNLIPKGEEAEAELRRIKRQERRRARAAKKRAEANGEVYVDELDTEPPPPVEFTGLPSVEETRAMFAEAFSYLGGISGLVAWGRRYPKEFYAIWARLCIPKNADNDAPEAGSLESMLAQLDTQKESVQ